MYRAGRQAEDFFLSVHNHCEGVKSLLEYMLFGQLVPSKEKFLVWEKGRDQIVGIQNDTYMLRPNNTGALLSGPGFETVYSLKLPFLCSVELTICSQVC